MGTLSPRHRRTIHCLTSLLSRLSDASKNGYAYTFCEIPEIKKLFVAVPECSIRQDSLPSSKKAQNFDPKGCIIEHSLDHLEQTKIHTFFSKSFFGRLVHLSCSQDHVQVGMSATHFSQDSRPHENILEFNPNDPQSFTSSFLKRNDVGVRVVYDKKHQGFFYVSEFDKQVFRYDLTTHLLDDHIHDRFYNPLHSRTGHTLENQGFHDRRDTLFIGEWFGGSDIYEISRQTYEPRRIYEPKNGGNHSIMVDEEENRLYASGIWGIDILAIPSGKILKRYRLSTAVRLAVIDRIHQLIYIPSTTGKVWVIDRKNLKKLGWFPHPGGSRNPYISQDGQFLFIGSNSEYGIIPTKKIAEYFRINPRSLAQ